MKRFFLSAIFCLILLPSIIFVSSDNKAFAETFSYFITQDTPMRPVLFRGETFYTKEIDINYQSGKIVLSSNDLGTGDTLVDDAIEIVVTRPNGSVASTIQRYDQGCIVLRTFPSLDITNLFMIGNNKVSARLYDICSAYISSSSLYLVNLNAPDPIPGPSPFLDLPWDYNGKGLTFNEAALSINSFFDHEYPLLGSIIEETLEAKGTIVKFSGFPRNRDDPYSSHDGYDYGIKAKVNNADPVLAAADGCASYGYSSAGGHTIKINHGNYYQTRYLHLQDTPDLITKDTMSCVRVVKGQKIGLVGSTGNSTGSHIHFMVVEDKDKDGNFDNNIPDGVTDPFGWQSTETDPWEIFSFFYNGLERTGNKSYYLWNKKLDSLNTTLTSNGGVFDSGRFKVEFPEDATDENLSVIIKSAPIVETLGNLVSIGTTLDISAFDLLGNIVTSFEKLFDITVDFSSFDLTRYGIDTFSFYSSTDGGITWTKEPTIVDMVTQTATTKVDHLTQFALMAERIDTAPPTTTATLEGVQGQPSWYMSDVTLTFNAEDNEGGLGVDYTLYKIETQENTTDWTQYASPLVFISEGHHKVQFYSVDKDENIEETKTVEFDIDTSPPEVVIDANPKEIWPPNGKMADVTITGFATDTNLLLKTFTVDDEYGLIKSTISDFNQTIQLEAKREGNDKDGRIYTITATAEDMAGNITNKQTQVIVPHDQGKKKR